MQVYAACGHGQQGTLRVFHSAAVLEELHTSAPLAGGIYRMWTAVMLGISAGTTDGTPQTLIVISFVNGTRIMSVGEVHTM